MKNLKLLFPVLGLLIVTLLSSCGDVNLKDDKKVADFLRKHNLELEGDWNFYKDGTFDLVPASPNDPNQLYKGIWTLGKYWECEIKGCDLNPTREITIAFANYGWVTDGHNFNGTNFSGVGRKLQGTIMNTSISGWFISFEDNNYTGGWVVDKNGDTQLQGKSRYQCDLKKKSSDKISTKETAGVSISYSNQNISHKEAAKDSQETAIQTQPFQENNEFNNTEGGHSIEDTIIEKMVENINDLLTLNEAEMILHGKQSCVQFSTIPIDKIKYFFKKEFCNETIFESGESFNCYGGKNNNCASVQLTKEGEKFKIQYSWECD